MKRVAINPLRLACAALAAGLCAAAQAQPYVGTGVGGSQFDADCAGTTRCDRTGTVYKVFAGYMVSQDFSVEAAYYRHGGAGFSASDPTLGQVEGRYKGEAVGVFGIFIAPYSNKFRLLGRIGAANTRTSRDVTASLGGAQNRSERHSNLVWGVGADYDITPSVGLRLEFERSRVKFADDKTDLDLVSTSLIYRF